MLIEAFRDFRFDKTFSTHSNDVEENKFHCFYECIHLVNEFGLELPCRVNFLMRRIVTLRRSHVFVFSFVNWSRVFILENSSIHIFPDSHFKELLYSHWTFIYLQFVLHENREVIGYSARWWTSSMFHDRLVELVVWWPVRLFSQLFFANMVEWKEKIKNE